MPVLCGELMSSLCAVLLGSLRDPVTGRMLRPDIARARPACDEGLDSERGAVGT